MNQKKHIRDIRSPKPKGESISKVMTANKAKNTKPKLILRKELTSKGVKGFRLHPKTILGRPDICFISKKIAIFLNGCFLHGCIKCNYTEPKNTNNFG
jgi:DNA mismatch endonuclease (patch repair protein)